MATTGCFQYRPLFPSSFSWIFVLRCLVVVDYFDGEVVTMADGAGALVISAWGGLGVLWKQLSYLILLLSSFV